MCLFDELDLKCYWDTKEEWQLLFAASQSSYEPASNWASSRVIKAQRRGWWKIRKMSFHRNFNDKRQQHTKKIKKLHEKSLLRNFPSFFQNWKVKSHENKKKDENTFRCIISDELERMKRFICHHPLPTDSLKFLSSETIMPSILLFLTPSLSLIQLPPNRAHTPTFIF